MNIGTWLRGLGLERYEASFRDNDIDPGAPPELTADDLIGLGVSSIGHRRKIAYGDRRSARRRYGGTGANQ